MIRLIGLIRMSLNYPVRNNNRYFQLIALKYTNRMLCLI